MAHGRAFVFIFLFLGIPAFSLEYVSPAQIQLLQDQYERSGPLTDWRSLDNSSWSCTLIGMRTHLQKQRFSGFYRFQNDKDHLKNIGSHFVQQFRFDGGELMGSSENVVERIRQDVTHHQLVLKIQSDKQQGSALLALGICDEG